MGQFSLATAERHHPSPGGADGCNGTMESRAGWPDIDRLGMSQEKRNTLDPPLLPPSTLLAVPRQCLLWSSSSSEVDAN